MKNFLALTAMIVATAVIIACGSNGSPPPPPTDVAVAPHDSSAVITWTAIPGVEYWVWVAPGSTVTPESCATLLACTVHRGVGSPFLLLGLINGTTYSLTITGRNDGDPVGSPSTPVSFVPNFAGTNWAAGTPLATSSLFGIAYTGVSLIASSSFVAVGAGGTLFSSPDGTTWTQLTSHTLANLNAAVFADSRFVIAGDSGVILASSDGVNYAGVNSKTSSNLYALGVNGGTIVAVGAGGAIVNSTDGLNWGAVSSGTSNNLYGAAAGNNVYVAVGANGTLLTSSDAGTWKTIALPTSADLRAVTFGLVPVSGSTSGATTNMFVVVGANGTLVTSTDGANWTVRAPIGSNTLNSVTFGSRFVAVGVAGNIFTSQDGVTWTQSVSATTNDLNSVAWSSGISTSTLSVGAGYLAAGVGGVLITSF
jgi:hypothetical protein